MSILASTSIPIGRRKRKKGRTRKPACGPEDVMAHQMCRSTNRQAEPDVWFRVVHATQNGHKGAPVAAYREQTVEIALGPKGAFENGNIGTLRRWAPPDQVLSAVSPGRGNPKHPREPKTPE